MVGGPSRCAYKKSWVLKMQWPTAQLLLVVFFRVSSKTVNMNYEIFGWWIWDLIYMANQPQFELEPIEKVNYPPWN